MDARLRKLIARPQRTVREGRRRILAQQALLARIDPASADAAIAQQVLQSHLITQMILEGHLAELRQILRDRQRSRDSAGNGRRAAGQDSDELA